MKHARRVLASAILIAGVSIAGTVAFGHDAPVPSDQATQINPAAKTYFTQGEDLAKKKSWEGAIQAYSQAVRLDPKFAEAWNNMGYCYRKVKQFDKALDAYKHALALKPDFTYAHEYMARTYVALGNKDAAMREYDILRRLDAKMADEVLKAIQAGNADLGDTD